MKKLCLFFMTLMSLLILSETTNARNRVYDAKGTNRLDVSTCVRVGDLWGENWNSSAYKIATNISNENFVITLYPAKDEAWNNYCKITLTDYVKPDKKAIKEHKKSKKWFEYQCEVEFYYSVKYPSIEECFANYGGFAVNAKDTEAKKRVVSGIIKFNPFFYTAGDNFSDNEDEKMVINLFFDEVGFAMYLLDHLEF